MRKSLLVLALAAVVFMSIGASADTLIGTNLYASGTFGVSGNNFNGTLTFRNTSSVDQIVVAWSLQLFGGTGVVQTISVTGLPAAWTSAPGKQSNNGSPCDYTNNFNWFCTDGFSGSGANTTFTPLILHNGSTTLTFSGTFSGSGPVTVLDLMANGCKTNDGTLDLGAKTKNGVTTYTPTVNCSANDSWKYSNPIDTHPPRTPEPASVALLGAGLLGLGGLIRRRK